MICSMTFCQVRRDMRGIAVLQINLGDLQDSSPVEAPLRFLRGEVEEPRAGHWYANFPVCRSSRRECNTGRLYCDGKVGIVFSWLFFTAMILRRLISTPVGS